MSFAPENIKTSEFGAKNIINTNAYSVALSPKYKAHTRREQVFNMSWVDKG